MEKAFISTFQESIFFNSSLLCHLYLCLVSSHTTKWQTTQMRCNHQNIPPPGHTPHARVKRAKLTSGPSSTSGSPRISKHTSPLGSPSGKGVQTSHQVSLRTDPTHPHWPHWSSQHHRTQHSTPGHWIHLSQQHTISETSQPSAYQRCSFHLSLTQSSVP